MYIQWTITQLFKKKKKEILSYATTWIKLEDIK